jgi:hypothetical protein
MPTPATDLADCTATALAALYRSGAASPVQALQAALRRGRRGSPRRAARKGS